MGRRRKIPSYRLHKPSGQAVVTLNGRDVYLGRYKTQVSYDEYDRVIAEWIANGRQLPLQDGASATVGEILVRYWDYARGWYGNGTDKLTPELYHLRTVMRVVRRLYGKEPAEAFGPRALKACRQVLIEEGNVRRTINQQVGRIKRMFSWAVEEELLPGSVCHGLQAVRSLKRGRSEAKEGRRVKPVPKKDIEAVLERVSPTVAAMIRVQLLTAMRPDELASMRGSDIDRSMDPWLYQPRRHKTERLGHDRPIFLGERAQAILEPLLAVAGEGHVFSPQRAEEARNARRRLARRSPMTPSQAARKRKPNRRRAWRDHYDKDSYRRAIVRACAEAGIEKWTPHRLRHTAATRLRRHYDLEGAQAVLGHASPDATKIYAHQLWERARRIMSEVG